MIPSHDANHRAIVDSDGNIILPGARKTDQHEEMFRVVREEADVQDMEEGLWYSPELENSLTLPWTATDSLEEEESAAHLLSFVEHVQKETVKDPFEEEETVTALYEDPILAMLSAGDENDELRIETAPTHVWNDVREQMFAVTNELIAEGSRQYQTSIVDGIRTSKSIVQTCKDGALRLWGCMTQPVWVPGRHNKPKQYGRGTLFLLDTVRFGGTFASLFVVLFVSLNFQSFWSIAHSYVDPLADITAGKKLTSELDSSLADKLKKIPSLATAGNDDNSLVAFLPDVGPPEDRLIIPKLDLNVPIVIPPNTNLLKEDWKGLEEDIQSGLQNGVVHYPGTARPGQAGNFFVTGHSSYFPWAPGKYKSVFARLGELKTGDEYWVYYGGDKYRYVVTDTKEIRPSDVTVLDQPVSKRVGSLMTCTPVGTTLRRLIINAQEIDPVTGNPMTVGERATENSAPKTKMEMLPI